MALTYAQKKYRKQVRENRAKWVAALRSGEYKQGKGKLRTRGNTYCCLGVACAIGVVGAGKWVKTAPIEDHSPPAYPWIFVVDDPEPDPDEFDEFVWSRSLTAELHGEQLDRLGLSPHQQETLILMNDGQAGSKRASFSEIADYIESLPIPNDPPCGG